MSPKIETQKELTAKFSKLALFKVPWAGAAISVAIVCSLSLPKELVIRKLIECSVYSNNERKK